jgi:hypothetical protein
VSGKSGLLNKVRTDQGLLIQQLSVNEQDMHQVMIGQGQGSEWGGVPLSEWDPASWRNDAGVAHNGDGYLLYPGPDLQPLSSVRLENLRDGIEDYEYLWLLRDNVQKLRKAGRGSKTLLDAADKALAIDDALCQDLTHYSQDPAALRAARRNLASLIEKTSAALR